MHPRGIGDNTRKSTTDLITFLVRKEKDSSSIVVSKELCLSFSSLVSSIRFIFHRKRQIFEFFLLDGVYSEFSHFRNLKERINPKFDRSRENMQRFADNVIAVTKE